MRYSYANKIFNSLVLVGLGVGSIFLDPYIGGINLEKLSLSFFWIAGLYFSLRFLFELALRKSINYSRTRYSLRKVLRIMFYFLSGLTLVNIWVESTESLIVTYGLFSAGVALALQDTLKNFFGGMTIYLAGLYQVGDRVDIDGTAGDVLDINFSYTTLLEINNWIAGDQPTGRIIYVPNQKVSAENTFNYTKDHGFIWDELVLPVTFASNWKKAKRMILEFLSTRLEEEISRAKGELELLGGKYYLEQRDVNPTVFLTTTDNWIELRVRYICNTFERREVADTIQEKIIEILDAEADIEIASQTLRIFGSHVEE